MKPTRLRLMLDDKVVRTRALGAAVISLEANSLRPLPPKLSLAINAALDAAIDEAERAVRDGRTPQSAQDAAPSTTVVRDHDET